MPITITHGWNPVVAGVIGSLVDEYNQRQDEDDQVQLVKAQGSSYGSAPKDALALLPDAQPHGFAGPEFLGPELYEAARQGKIIPIETYLDGRAARICDLVRQTFSSPDGKLYSMPINPACGVLFYNEGLLTRVNVLLGKPENFVPTTAEELDEISRGLIEHKIARGGYTCAWPTAYLVEVPAARSGRFIAEPLNGKNGYGDFKLNQEWLVRHLMDLRDQVKSGVFRYPGLDKSSESKDLFLRGDICFYMQGSSWESLLKAKAIDAPIAFKVGSAALPILLKGQITQGSFPLGGTGLYILNNQKTKDKEAAIRRFVEYLASVQFQRVVHEKCSSVPVSLAVVEVMQKEGVYDKNPLLKAVIDQTILPPVPVEEASFGIGMPNWDKARNALGQLVFDILTSEDETSDSIRSRLLYFDEEFSVPKQ